MKTKLTINTKSLLGDLQTPIGIYLKVRDLCENSVLLESSDYNSATNSNSYIAFEPLASYTVEKGVITQKFPDRTVETIEVKDKLTVPETFDRFIASFDCIEGVLRTPSTNAGVCNTPLPKNAINGFFGYSAYGAVQYFEDVKLRATPKAENNMPEIHYALFRYVIALNHHKNEITIIENLLSGEESRIADIETMLESPNIALYDFQKVGEESSDISDEDFRQMVTRGKQECYRGNVFQIVLSRRFRQAYKGDDIKLYRTLRSVNPSPYLFYFDFGSFRIFGSSPEAHLMVKGGKAYITPIAGTFRRTGDDEKDRILAERLRTDPKENAEHIMLVDLARNDLSRNAEQVVVDEFRTVQYYSHVLHLVSSVSGVLPENANIIKLFADTFPAGTLSGAPKVKAMQLIDEIEKHDRGFYGGCIGYIGFDGSFNQAITIRSFLSRNNVLYYQAGAGVVAKSVEESELQEVNNKLGALTAAIARASV
ncbi:MAG: anthranilate synthase component I family protein [Prevotellaceae bacterium]|jgi:anthranilate synthase component 1|nr:anthranilate synthase component I family protein [Prevotellaceae bacterium]